MTPVVGEPPPPTAAEDGGDGGKRPPSPSPKKPLLSPQKQQQQQPRRRRKRRRRSSSSTASSLVDDPVATPSRRRVGWALVPLRNGSPLVEPSPNECDDDDRVEGDRKRRSDAANGEGRRRRRRRRERAPPWLLLPPVVDSEEDDLDSDDDDDDDPQAPKAPSGEAEEAEPPAPSSLILGRKELLTAHRIACGCCCSSSRHRRRRQRSKKEKPEEEMEEERDGAAASSTLRKASDPSSSSSRRCRACDAVDAWGIPFLSRRMVRLTPISPSVSSAPNDDDDGDVDDGEVVAASAVVAAEEKDSAAEEKRERERRRRREATPRWRIEVSGQNASELVRVDGRPVVFADDDDDDGVGGGIGGGDEDSKWKGGRGGNDGGGIGDRDGEVADNANKKDDKEEDVVCLRVGSVLSFGYHSDDGGGGDFVDDDRDARKEGRRGNDDRRNRATQAAAVANGETNGAGDGEKGEEEEAGTIYAPGRPLLQFVVAALMPLGPATTTRAAEPTTTTTPPKTTMAAVAAEEEEEESKVAAAAAKKKAAAVARLKDDRNDDEGGTDDGGSLTKRRKESDDERRAVSEETKGAATAIDDDDDDDVDSNPITADDGADNDGSDAVHDGSGGINADDGDDDEAAKRLDEAEEAVGSGSKVSGPDAGICADDEEEKEDDGMEVADVKVVGAKCGDNEEEEHRTSTRLHAEEIEPVEEAAERDGKEKEKAAQVERSNDKTSDVDVGGLDAKGAQGVQIEKEEMEKGEKVEDKRKEHGSSSIGEGGDEVSVRSDGCKGKEHGSSSIGVVGGGGDESSVRSDGCTDGEPSTQPPFSQPPLPKEEAKSATPPGGRVAGGEEDGLSSIPSDVGGPSTQPPLLEGSTLGTSDGGGADEMNEMNEETEGQKDKGPSTDASDAEIPPSPPHPSPLDLDVACDDNDESRPTVAGVETLGTEVGSTDVMSAKETKHNGPEAETEGSASGSLPDRRGGAAPSPEKEGDRVVAGECCADEGVCEASFPACSEPEVATTQAQTSEGPRKADGGIGTTEPVGNDVNGGISPRNLTVAANSAAKDGRHPLPRSPPREAPSRSAAEATRRTSPSGVAARNAFGGRVRYGEGNYEFIDEDLEFGDTGGFGTPRKRRRRSGAGSGGGGLNNTTGRVGRRHRKKHRERQRSPSKKEPDTEAPTAESGASPEAPRSLFPGGESSPKGRLAPSLRGEDAAPAASLAVAGGSDDDAVFDFHSQSSMPGEVDLIAGSASFHTGSPLHRSSGGKQVKIIEQNSRIGTNHSRAVEEASETNALQKDASKVRKEADNTATPHHKDPPTSTSNDKPRQKTSIHNETTCHRTPVAKIDLTTDSPLDRMAGRRAASGGTNMQIQKCPQNDRISNKIEEDVIEIDEDETQLEPEICATAIPQHRATASTTHAEKGGTTETGANSNEVTSKFVVDLSSPGGLNERTNRSQDKSSRASGSGNKEGSTDYRQCVVLFLKLGKNMTTPRIDIMSSALNKKKGFIVIKSLIGDPMPTHVVIDSNVTASSAAAALGFQNSDRMEKEFKKRNICAVRPEWAIQPGDTFQEPTLGQCWGGFINATSAKALGKLSRGEKCAGKSNAENAWVKRTKRDDEFGAISVVKASSVKDNAVVSRILKKRTLHANTNAATIKVPCKEKRLLGVPFGKKPAVRNEKLSKLFKDISKLYKDCPLDWRDPWKAYMYDCLSGRLRHLDFEVTLNRDVLKRLRKIKGFGASALRYIEENLVGQPCSKIAEFERDPARIAIRNMIQIWGVGMKTAAELVKSGYTTIDQVRAALMSGELDLSDNARIGVDCYEDFQEKMERDEVRKIGDIVAQACWEKFRGASVEVMGSYRRGKATSGDCDILITHPSFVETTPRGALGELVNRLKNRGVIAFHLTRPDDVASARSGLEEDSERLKYSDDSEQFSQSAAVQHCAKSASYMGVFYSPVFPQKRRRVDIKWYPYQERAFATLYFTGSGFFNRSMRLWAKKAKGIALNDHGMYPINNSGAGFGRKDNKEFRGARMHAESEAEIFSKLDLEYKEPNERDCFDAVVQKGTERPVELELGDGDMHGELSQPFID